MLFRSLYGNGDAVIGVNPASDDAATTEALLRMLDRLRETLEIPTQICVLAHITTQMEALRRGAPIDLVFQSIAGTQAANAAFGVTLSMPSARVSTQPTKVRYLPFDAGAGRTVAATAYVVGGGYRPG